MKKLIVNLLCLLFATQAFAQTSIGGGIIYGPNHSYMLSAPKGWIMDNSSGVSVGIHAVFYPEGGNWVDAKEIMYTNYITVVDTVKLQEFIDADAVDFKHNGDEIIKHYKDYTSKKKNKFSVYYFEYSKDKMRAYEYIAYLRAPTGVMMLVLHCKDPKKLKKDYAKLKELMESYSWLSSDIKIEE